jgi:hypothetical protein
MTQLEKVIEQCVINNLNKYMKEHPTTVKVSKESLRETVLSILNDQRCDERCDECCSNQNKQMVNDDPTNKQQVNDDPTTNKQQVNDEFAYINECNKAYNFGYSNGCTETFKNISKGLNISEELLRFTIKLSNNLEINDSSRISDIFKKIIQ